eukprot:EC725200.1.p1 GENE.EC725200.1~~EC725200.1.p1  ORF type:complete len:184 (+),score=28.60 EC725200.1:132-683(+)
MLTFGYQMFAGKGGRGLGAIGSFLSLAGAVSMMIGTRTKRKQYAILHAVLSFLSIPTQMVPVGFAIRELAMGVGTPLRTMFAFIALVSCALALIGGILAPIFVSQFAIRAAAMRAQNETVGVVTDLNPIHDPREKVTHTTMVNPITAQTAAVVVGPAVIKPTTMTYRVNTGTAKAAMVVTASS